MHRLFPVNLVKLLRASLLQNTSGQLLLEIKRLGKISVKHFCKSLQGVMYKSTFTKKVLNALGQTIINYHGPRRLSKPIETNIEIPVKELGWSVLWK